MLYLHTSAGNLVTKGVLQYRLQFMTSNMTCTRLIAIVLDILRAVLVELEINAKQISILRINWSATDSSRQFDSNTKKVKWYMLHSSIDSIILPLNPWFHPK